MRGYVFILKITETDTEFYDFLRWSTLNIPTRKDLTYPTALLFAQAVYF